MLKLAANDPSLTMLRAAANWNYVVLCTNRRFGDREFSVTVLKPGTVYPETSRLLPVQRMLSNIAWRPVFFQKGLPLTLRLLLLQLFYQCFYYYHYHLRCHHCYHHHFMLCTIGLYVNCRRCNRNDCFTITILLLLSLRDFELCSKCRKVDPLNKNCNISNFSLFKKIHFYGMQP